MEPIKNVGGVAMNEDTANWIIPNFYDLPQECNTVIRSPHFPFIDGDWYMEVYPGGRRLYSSSGWFGISARNINSKSNLHGLTFGVQLSTKTNHVTVLGECQSDGFYCCNRFLPTSLLKSWRDLFAPGDDLYLYVYLGNEKCESVDCLTIKLKTEEVQKWFQENFENACIEPSAQAAEENGMSLQNDIGELSYCLNGVIWKIPNFSNIPKEYETIIRSPRFLFKDSHWYMEVYPYGRRLYSSLGWFGVGVLNLNSDSNLRHVRFGFYRERNKNSILVKASSYGNGYYGCTRLLPTSLLNYEKDISGPTDNLHVLLDFSTMNDGVLWMRYAIEDVQKMYEQIFENRVALRESSTQTEGEIGMEKLKLDFEEILLA